MDGNVWEETNVTGKSELLILDGTALFLEVILLSPLAELSTSRVPVVLTCPSFSREANLIFPMQELKAFPGAVTNQYKWETPEDLTYTPLLPLVSNLLMLLNMRYTV